MPQWLTGFTTQFNSWSGEWLKAYFWTSIQRLNAQYMRWWVLALLSLEFLAVSTWVCSGWDLNLNCSLAQHVARIRITPWQGILCLYSPGKTPECRLVLAPDEDPFPWCGWWLVMVSGADNQVICLLRSCQEQPSSEVRSRKVGCLLSDPVSNSGYGN